VDRGGGQNSSMRQRLGHGGANMEVGRAEAWYVRGLITFYRSGATGRRAVHGGELAAGDGCFQDGRF
jgi:hypothetical protein